MQKPSKRQRKTLERATANYEMTRSPAAGYLRDRGIDEETAAIARIGVVVSPEPGHEQYISRLVIPYVDMLGVYALKFRCIAHEDCKTESCSKYLALPGQDVSIYGVLDCDSVADTIHVAEGELDRIILKLVFPDDAAVGIPGVQTWQAHWPFHFAGFERVLVWADGDKAGQDLGNRIRKEVRNAEVVAVPRGMDVTDLYLAVGPDVMRSMVGEEETE